MDKIIKMRQKRAEIVAAAKAALAKYQGGGDGAEEAEAKFDELMAEADKLQETIERAERLQAAEADLNAEIDETAAGLGISADNLRDDEDREGAIFHNWLCFGLNGISAEDRQFMNERRVKSGQEGRPRNAQEVGAPSTGGYLVPTGFVRRIEVAMREFGGVATVATDIRTRTGNSLPWPTMNDTSNEGELVGESVKASEQDVAFGQLTLGAYKFSTKSIRLSLEFLQDNEVGFVQNYLSGVMAERLARVHNRYHTTGTGVDQPEGIVAAAPVGLVGTTQTGISFDNLIDLEHSIDPAYRGTARFMFHDTTLRTLRKLKDADGRPLWQDSLKDGSPALINGKPYTINQNMDEMTAGKDSVLFGQLKKFHIRRVLDLSIRRLDEKYAEEGQVAFLGFERRDSKLIDAGANPVKKFRQAA